jgi:NlpC/P60 family
VLRFSQCSAVGVMALAASAVVVGAQQPDINVTLNPFVTLMPRTSGPMTGLAITLAGGPLAIRAGGHISLQERGAAGATNAAAATRPWGADADALAYLESFTYGDFVRFTPYVFTGVSTAAVDSGSLRLVHQGWSYGGGMALPIGSVVGLFGEMRWRMSRFVLPDAADAPTPVSEVRLGVAFRIGSGGGSGRAVPTIIPADDGDEASGSTNLSTNAVRVLSTADEFVGTPYRRGGTSPSSGFDASGFVRFVFARLGVNLPRTSRDQARVGQRVSANWHSIAPGDLVMFQDDGGINHVAIYVGKNKIIHSSETGGGVRYDDLSTARGRWFLDHMVAARRVTPDLRGVMLNLARGYSTNEPSGADGPDHAPRASLKRRP